MGCWKTSCGYHNKKSYKNPMALQKRVVDKGRNIES